MGDRANIVFNTKGVEADATLAKAMEGSIVLYSHWGGHDLGPDLAKALKHAKPRWHDEASGTRMIVSRIIGEDWSSEAGFGLSVGALADNNNPVLVVDFTEQRVLCYAGEAEGAARVSSFEIFSNLSEDDARAFHLGAY